MPNGQSKRRSPRGHRHLRMVEGVRHRRDPRRRRRRPRAKTGRTPPVPRSSTAASGQGGRGARIPDLRPRLRSLGLPDPYVPQGQRPSLDQLANAMGTLPEPPALPTHRGAVVAVMGSDRDLDRTVDIVRAELSLGPRDVLRFAGESRNGPRRG